LGTSGFIVLEVAPETASIERLRVNKAITITTTGKMRLKNPEIKCISTPEATNVYPLPFWVKRGFYLPLGCPVSSLLPLIAVDFYVLIY
jgi:hypothetical protein